MLAMLNSLNAHNLPIFQPIMMILVSKFMVHIVLSDKTYLSLGLLSPLSGFQVIEQTRFVTDRQTDGQTVGQTDRRPGKNNMSPDPKGGRHK